MMVLGTNAPYTFLKIQFVLVRLRTYCMYVILFKIEFEMEKLVCELVRKLLL